jgi:hypothetical protein
MLVDGPDIALGAGSNAFPVYTEEPALALYRSSTAWVQKVVLEVEKS